MNVYEVLIHGRGLKLLDDQDTVREGGVYVWRVVRAEDEGSAVELAGKTVLNDQVFLDELRNDSIDEVTLEAEEVRGGTPESDGVDTGFVFYIEEED